VADVAISSEPSIAEGLRMSRAKRDEQEMAHAAAINSQASAVLIGSLRRPMRSESDVLRRDRLIGLVGPDRVHVPFPSAAPPVRAATVIRTLGKLYQEGSTRIDRVWRHRKAGGGAAKHAGRMPTRG